MGQVRQMAVNKNMAATSRVQTGYIRRREVKNNRLNKWLLY
jgi:hypothetical protein